MAEAQNLDAREEAALLRAREAQREVFERAERRRAQSARINRERWRRMTPAEYEAALAKRRASGR